MIEALTQAKIDSSLYENGEITHPFDPYWISPTSHGVDRMIPEEKREEILAYAKSRGNFGLIYEEVCFASLNEQIRSGLAIGPHITDSMFGQGLKFKPPPNKSRRNETNNTNDCTSTIIRPDGFWLALEDGKVTLKSYYEFKSGNNFDQVGSDINTKIAGLNRLTKIFRKNPRLFPKMLDQEIGSIYNIPDEIEVPERVDIVFYTPDLRQPMDGVPYAEFRTKPVPFREKQAVAQAA